MNAFAVTHKKRYIEFTRSLAPKPIALDNEALRFVALEVEVGPWAGFWWIREIDAVQYSLLAKRTVKETVADREYAKALHLLWNEVGAVYIHPESYDKMLGRLAILMKLPPDSDRVLSVARRNERVAIFRKRHWTTNNCPVKGSGHSNECCVLCAIPGRWAGQWQDASIAYPADPRGCAEPDRRRTEEGSSVGAGVR